MARSVNFVAMGHIQLLAFEFKYGLLTIPKSFSPKSFSPELDTLLAKLVVLICVTGLQMFRHIAQVPAKLKICAFGQSVLWNSIVFSVVPNMVDRDDKVEDIIGVKVSLQFGEFSPSFLQHIAR